MLHEATSACSRWSLLNCLANTHFHNCCFVHRSTTVDEWEQNSQSNKERAEAELKTSAELREATVLAIAQVN